MGEPYGGVLITNCTECGKAIDLFEAKKYMALGPKNIDDPAYCEDCYYKAICDECGKEVKYSIQVFCSCGPECHPSHEDLVWCSQSCMEKAHDGPEPEPEDCFDK